jgi:hypothetical protein
MGHGTGGSARRRMAVARASVLAGVLLLAPLASGVAHADEATPNPIVLPPGDVAEVGVGSARRFSAIVTEHDVEYLWTVDGARVGTDRTFEYVPETRDIGTHEIAVTVLHGSAAARHTWRVTVAPPPVPTILDVAPATAVVHARPGERVGFRYVVTSSVATDHVAVVWTVDGKRVGEGPSFSIEVAEGPAERVRAVASSALGVVQAREWRLVPGGPAVATARVPGEVPPDKELEAILKKLKPEHGPGRREAAARSTTTVRVARVAPTSTVRRAEVMTTSTARRAEASTTSTVRRAEITTTSVARHAARTTTTVRPVPRVVARAAPPPARPAPRPTITPRPSPPTTLLAALPQASQPTAPPPVHPGITREEVLAFLARYARAYESRSVGELERIGQITGERQADALGRYFEQVRDLHVDVRLLGVEPRGDGVRIRYRRRDRFRDPTGRIVDKETPPIEKDVRRTPSGLVFTPSS